MSEIREQITPPNHEPRIVQAVLGVHRNKLEPEVRVYADNLNAQILGIFQTHHVKSVSEFEDAARARNISIGTVKEVHRLFTRLRAAVEKGKIPAEGIQEYLKDERYRQAQNLFDKGWGKVLGLRSFVEYLATIPDAPLRPERWKDRFDRLVLVDDRIPFSKACEYAGLSIEEPGFVPHATAPTTSVYWMYANDGRHNERTEPDVCRQLFLADETGLNTVEGVSLYLTDAGVINSFTIELVGSMDEGRCANIGPLEGGAGVSWDWANMVTSQQYGTASRGVFSSLPPSA